MTMMMTSVVALASTVALRRCLQLPLPFRNETILVDFCDVKLVRFDKTASKKNATGFIRRRIEQRSWSADDRAPSAPTGGCWPARPDRSVATASTSTVCVCFVDRCIECVVRRDRHAIVPPRSIRALANICIRESTFRESVIQFARMIFCFCFVYH
jgi:hypothetical protein